MQLGLTIHLTLPSPASSPCPSAKRESRFGPRAAGSGGISRFPESATESSSHLRFRYVVVNPSTYLYLGPERPSNDSSFQIPDRQACPGYNEWHYGLENRNSYALRLTEEEIEDRLVSRDVVYMVGTADTGEEALDMTCGAMLQGEHRYSRGLALYQYMETRYPASEHELVEVAGVGHSSTRMYQSPQGRQVLFNW